MIQKHMKIDSTVLIALVRLKEVGEALGVRMGAPIAKVVRRAKGWIREFKGISILKDSLAV